MAIPRGKLVDDSESGIYHCVSRCVRQSFLLTNHTPPASPLDAPLLPDDHRRDWFLDRLALLTDVFAIDCVSLAVMSNHLHLLLRTLPEIVGDWSDPEVAYRWRMLHPDLAMRRSEGIARERGDAKREAKCKARRGSGGVRHRGVGGAATDARDDGDARSVIPTIEASLARPVDLAAISRRSRAWPSR